MTALLIILCIIVLLLIIYLLMIMPRVFHKPSVKQLFGSYYAHRGLHDNQSPAPENSLAAFRLAVESGYGIELDVQLSKDNIPVVFHDFSLKRICGVDKKVNELTFNELQQLRLLGSGERIPLFSDVLALVDGKVPLIVEIKIEAFDTSVCPIAQKLLDAYTGVYCIESFNPLCLLWYKKNRPKIVRGQLSSNFIADKTPGSKAQYFCLQNLLLNFLTRPDFIAYDIRYTHMLSFTLCRKLYHTLCVAWTVRNQGELDAVRHFYQLFIFQDFLPSKK